MAWGGYFFLRMMPNNAIPWPMRPIARDNISYTDIGVLLSEA